MDLPKDIKLELSNYLKGYELITFCKIFSLKLKWTKRLVKDYHINYSDYPLKSKEIYYCQSYRLKHKINQRHEEKESWGYGRMISLMEHINKNKLTSTSKKIIKIFVKTGCFWDFDYVCNKSCFDYVWNKFPKIRNCLMLKFCQFNFIDPSISLTLTAGQLSDFANTFDNSSIQCRDDALRDYCKKLSLELLRV